MPNYVLSSNNRFYAKVEASYGQAASVGAQDRLAAVGLRVKQVVETPERRDKTGSRTYTGTAPGGRKRTEFGLRAYLTENPAPGSAPAAGALVSGCLGAPPLQFSGGTAGPGSSAAQVTFSSAHGLVRGQAIHFKGEMRFVKAVQSTTAVTLNAPLSSAPAAGETIHAATTYLPANEMPSVSIYDYWDPAAAVDRIVTGGAVDQMRIRLNGDYHEMEFRGPAKDVIDSVSFQSGQGALASFPAEPGQGAAAMRPVPGNLGQAWLGEPAVKFLTLTGGTIEIDNEADLRSREFGSATPLGISPGVRRVTADFELFEADDAATRSLYAAARSETPISVMFQLGDSAGRILGVWLPAAVPQAPEFDDGDRILAWRFQNSRAQGSANDEVAVAFG